MKKLSYFTILTIVSLIVLMACTQEQSPPTPVPSPTQQQPAAKPATAPTQEQTTAKPVSSPTAETYTHQSLATGSPGMNRYSEAKPGQATKVERAYAGAPPVVPHSLAGLALSKDSNACLSCHTAGIELSPGHAATKIPDSHYTNLQTGQKSTTLDGRRYYCLSCHVPQSPDKPLLQGGN